MNRTTLRQARMEDVDLILELIRGLAEFEKLSHQVQVTREQLQSTLFGARPAAEVVLAFDGENVVGFAVPRSLLNVGPCGRAAKRRSARRWAPMRATAEEMDLVGTPHRCNRTWGVGALATVMVRPRRRCHR